MPRHESLVRQLDQSTYCIDQFDVHLYLLLGSRLALLWDTGFSFYQDLPQVISSLTSLPLMVVNSHGHLDHSGGNLQFPLVYADPSGFSYVQEYQGGPGSLSPLVPGSTLDLGGRSFEVLSLPGHQTGHLGLLSREEGILLSGDNVTTTPVVMYLPGSDLDLYRSTLTELDRLKGAYTRILPSHGDIPTSPDQIARLLACLDAYRAGQLTGRPAVGPDGAPCVLYTSGGASFYFPD